MPANRQLRVQLVAIATSIAVLSPGPAWAQTATEMETARDLFTAAKAQRDAGDARGALEKFKQAHSLGNTPITGLELGKSHASVGELVEARDVFLSVGRIPVKPTESTNAKEARAEADKLAAEIKPRIPTITIVLSGLSAGSTGTVKMDGTAVKPAALGVPLKVNPGKHVIVARDGDAAETRVEIVLKEGETKNVPLVVAASTSAPAVLGAGQVAAPNGAKIGGSTEEEKVAEEERDARAKGVEVAFASPEPSMRWTLRHADGFELCALPCTRWIGLKSGYYLQREGDAGTSAGRVTVPMNWNYAFGTKLDATTVPERGNVTAATAVTVIGAVAFLTGLVLLLAPNECKYESSTQSVATQYKSTGFSGCTSSFSGFAFHEADRPFLLNWGPFLLGAAGLGGGIFWLTWSHPAHVDATPTGRVDKGGITLGPGGAYGTF